MKKTIIAGAASAVLAAMPVMGVFAAVENPSNIVDYLNVTITESCAWTRTLTNGSGVTLSGDNTLGATMTAGQEIETFGTSTLNVKCNHSTGYAIKATMTGLKGQNSSSDDTANGDSIDYASTLAEGKWTATYNGTGITSGTPFVTTDGASDMVDGTNYVVTYGVHTKNNQKAGYYKGTVTYELTQNN